MLITVKYFGMIAEQTNRNQEVFTIEPKMSISQLESIILTKYPTLKKSTYNIALNQKIINKKIKLSNKDELAFLPPFAGG